MGGYSPHMHTHTHSRPLTHPPPAQFGGTPPTHLLLFHARDVLRIRARFRDFGGPNYVVLHISPLKLGQISRRDRHQFPPYLPAVAAVVVRPCIPHLTNAKERSARGAPRIDP